MNNNNNSKTTIRSVYYCIIIILVVALAVHGVYCIFLRIPSLPQPTAKTSAEMSIIISNSTNGVFIPKIIHQMWKDDPENMPIELARWKEGCKVVNKEFDFRLYLDVDLERFVHQYYPEYLSLFRSLKGVYMADMARIIVVYHFGGIYMDLDFYCHRPFHCLIHQINTKYLSNHPQIDNMLVVSLEPVVHAELFRHKERVVIQDFFLTTPKHPFLKWLLDDRQQQYDERVQSNSTLLKGPFSYSIEKDIDRYYNYLSTVSTNNKNQLQINRKRMVLDSHDHSILNMINSHRSKVKKRHTSGTTAAASFFPTKPPVPVGYIFELPESVLHSLVDQTNSRLSSACNDIQRTNKEVSSVVTPQPANSSCSRVRRGDYFRPRSDTIAVHMWSHVYLGWNYVRTAYNNRVYRSVEEKLPPTFSCQSGL